MDLFKCAQKPPEKLENHGKCINILEDYVFSLGRMYSEVGMLRFEAVRQIRTCYSDITSISMFVTCGKHLIHLYDLHTAFNLYIHIYIMF